MNGYVKKIILLLNLAFPLAELPASSLEAHRAWRDGEVTSWWHGGPFFEYKRTVGFEPADGDREARLATFWAFRPFYSQVRAPNAVRRDFLWPVAAFHETREQAWWRAFFLAYGDARADDSWSWTLFPLAFGGRDRSSGGYWGVFPLYGEHPHFLLMDNWRFVLWPVWMDYDVASVHHGAVLWPIVTWKENDTVTLGVWPILSHARLRESDHWYVFWPLVTWARYDEDRDTGGAGTSWMVWPLYGNVSRARESQHLVLPPFFSYAKTPESVRWRMPWPLVDVERGATRNRVSVWPFYEYLDGFDYADRSRPAAAKAEPHEHTRRYLWKICEDTTLETETTRMDRFLLFPFWTSERRQAKGKDGGWRDVSSYLRIWPFYSSDTDRGITRRQALELLPIRHAEGFERNWSPFWTFWSSTTRADGTTEHIVLWHLFDWISED